MTDPVTTTFVTVPAITVELQLSDLARFGDGENGRLIAISYQHEPFYPHLSGPVLHFQLPDGRVVLTSPDPDGYELRWQDGKRAQGSVDAGAAEVLHLMWDQVDASFQDTLLGTFGDAVVRALSDTLSPRPDRVDRQSVTEESGPVPDTSTPGSDTA